MRLHFNEIGGDRGWAYRLLLLIAAVATAMTLAGPAGYGAEPAASATAAPGVDNAMGSSGLLPQIFMRLEDEATSDISMLPDMPGAIEREWRTFDRNGSTIGALINLGWVVLLGGVALLAEKGVALGLSRRLRRAMRLRLEGPTVGGLLALMLCDFVALGVFVGIFVHGRHSLTSAGVTEGLIVLATNVAIRWRIFSIIVGVVLRPRDASARLIELSDREAQRLSRFLSATVLAVIVLVGFGRYGLMDEDSGAPHIVALVVAAMVCGLYAAILFRSRDAFERLLRGRSSGLVGAMRGALARAWIAMGLTLVAGLFVFFVFGLSLGLLSYYHGIVSTLGVWFVLLVLERLTERGWQQPEQAGPGSASHIDRLVAQSLHRIVRAFVLLAAAVVLASIWTDALELAPSVSERAMRATIAATATLFVAYVAWELIRVAIDRHLQALPLGPRMPGMADDEEEGGPGSRLQTVLPMLRIIIGALIAVVAMLVVLSRLGIDTAPLIAGAGVFGLAISFGSQSLVRDIISGLFFMWDDAFRIGEYIDAGRLKGTVEALGIRSAKVRHHNGPLHTIPYGQLGSVTNMSRDFATIKFNLRLEPRSDIELVRKTAKKIGLEMQQMPAIAAEVMLPLKMQGIAEITDTAIVMRFKFTARPVKPSWIQREYLKRMYQVFAEQGIKFASGTLTLQTVPSSSPFPAERGPGDGERTAPAAAAAAAAMEATMPTMLPAATRVA